ncbi:MAG: hypothetical protein CSA33_05045 [Desulfobulbus propionicus]|nr:MAG: hypothetical protein CSA33_05045 [Desulfobulbus propionicus]
MLALPSENMVADGVSWVVQWGLTRRYLDNNTAIGVDQIEYKKWQRYLTLVYQIDRHCRRLFWMGKKRQKKTLHDFCDFWVRSALDWFHIVAKLTKTLDEVRGSEVKKLKEEGKPAYLKNSRWLFLKKKKRLQGQARRSLRDLLTMNLRTRKAYLFKEDFDHLWRYTFLGWASIFIDQWTPDVVKHGRLPEFQIKMKDRGSRLKKQSPYTLNQEI